MGARTKTETVAGVYQSFLQRRTWSQAALAKDLEVSVGILEAESSEEPSDHVVGLLDVWLQRKDSDSTRLGDVIERRPAIVDRLCAREAPF